MEEPRWLKENVVAAIHQRQLAEHGGLDGVREPGKFTSALARTRNTFAYTQPKPDLATLEASYAFGVIKNHTFIDGNKRAALGACLVFLRLIGIQPEPDSDEWEKLTLAVAASEIDRDEMTIRLRKLIRAKKRR